MGRPRGEVSAWWQVLFRAASRRTGRDGFPIIRLAGLDPDALYRLVDADRVLTGAGGSNPSGYPGTSTRSSGAGTEALSGKAWSEIGVRLDLGDLESTIIRLKRA